ncbi:MAG: anthranilate phosphoribosyltransferase [Gemmataceae bacterium]
MTNSAKHILTALIARQNLSAEETFEVMAAMLEGRFEEPQIVAALVALRTKGETGQELAGAADYMRQRMVRLDSNRTGILDTCGTGGDGSGTFNISTATALVAAGAGVPVVKHGNRAVSSRTGSGDVLSVLGVPCDGEVGKTRRCLEETGFAFCLAPLFHPALKPIADLRRRLGVPTLFNFIGPLLNPASACYQLIGVGDRQLLDPLAEALAQLGAKRAFLVCGRDGLDEVTLTGPTDVREVRGHKVTALQWQPEDFGLPRCRVDDLLAANPEESAARITSVLSGQPGPAADMVMANAAAAFLAAERVSDLMAGVTLARDTIQSGKALKVLQRLASNSKNRP